MSRDEGDISEGKILMQNSLIESAINQNKNTPMSLIKKPHELKAVSFIKALIYGQPGCGKSTLALSAPAPLFFDFDNGAHRVKHTHLKDTVQIESWENMLDVLNTEDLSAYKSFVCDTAGKLLDFLAAYLIAKNPKLGKANGVLTLQGYGERKAAFNAFLHKVALMGKHLVFVAHDKEEKDGDQKIIRPEIGGSSGGDLIKELDLVGYMEMKGKQRTISFDPTERYYGKNTCQLPSLINIPDLEKANAKNELLSDIFANFQKSMEERKAIAAQYVALIEDIEARVAAIIDADTANAASDWAKGYENHIYDSKLQAGMRISTKAKELGLILNAQKKYEPSNTPENAAV